MNYSPFLQQVICYMVCNWVLRRSVGDWLEHMVVAEIHRLNLIGPTAHQ